MTHSFAEAGEYAIKGNVIYRRGTSEGGVIDGEEFWEETYNVVDPISLVTITGANDIMLGTDGTRYSLSTYSLPSGVSFSGYTLTPETYTTITNSTAPAYVFMSGGLSSTSFIIRSYAIGEYTLTANFILPDGSDYVITKKITVVPPPPVITSDVTSTTMGGRVAFSVQGTNPQLGITYDWMINGVLSTLVSNFG